MCPPRYRFQGAPKLRRVPEGIELIFPQSTYRVDRWPTLRMTYRSAAGESREVLRPFRQALMEALDGLRLGNDLTQRLAVYDLIRDLPAWVHVRLVPMREFYWQGLSTLAELPSAIGLLESSPGLFAAVSSYHARGVFAAEDLDTLRKLVSGRQRDLIQWLGIGQGEAHCKIIRKLSAYDLTYLQWRRFGQNLRLAPVADLLQKLPSVDRWTVECLCTADPAKLLTPSFLREVLVTQRKTSMPADPGVALDQVVEQAELLRRAGIIRAPLHTYREFTNLQDHWGSLVADLSLCVGPEVDLPGLVPIASPRDLKAEGEIMQHCVGSPAHISAALKGQHCYYRLFHPVRATICLERVSQFGPWRLGAVHGPRNADVPKTAFDALETAFKQAGVQVSAAA